ncbi:hypothetical protein E3N88_37669 [Mikania micrantha]|uniref:Vacuolar protein sorting-associated protein Ist1 n=1 Tax=Mikania micrantha TaxID=192012 RepID=A0A5N6LU52_9ASTR|nr:hypothetical protein E3N88_37669 [Mikania micrantha]
MGRRIDALLHRRSKLKTTINLAISRLAILKNNRHARFSIARADLIQLLRLNHHQQALLRVEQVIKDQNMLAVYNMIHDYCHLLKQRVKFIEQAIDCPEELKEAVSSLLYAAPRCGEFPELQEIRAILTARFGKELGGAIVLKTKVAVALADSESPNSDDPQSPDRNMLNSEHVKSKLQMNDMGSIYDSESDYDEITEEDEGEISKYNMEEEEYDDLYPNDYSNDDNIKSFEKMDFDGSKYDTEAMSRTVYFSSYKQFPFRHQANPKTGN